MKKMTSLAALASALTFAAVTTQVQADNSNMNGQPQMMNGKTMPKSMEGKCGEGKCGATSAKEKSAEGKCGEGKCGASQKPKMAEGSCGANHK